MITMMDNSNDIVKKSLFSFLVILFMLGTTIGAIGVMEQNAMLANLDALTLMIVTLIPFILAVSIIYAIWKADFLT